MLRDFSIQALATGILAAIVGFASSFPVVLQGLTAVGASQREAASGLMALSLAMGICAIWLSLRHRQPISIAWSTPGAALLATSATVDGGFATAVGAFLVCGVLIVITGLWKQLGQWVASIPTSLANAMLAGVLLGLCLAPVRAAAEIPYLALPVIAVWAVLVVFKRLYAVPVAVALTMVLIGFTTPVVALSSASLLPDPVLIAPHFSIAGVIGIALPLFIVTMASQNIPGITVLRVNGYEPQPGPLFTATGIFSILSAPFGGHAVNLAAITAAMCAGEDAHDDPSRRYWSAIVAGAGYIVFGLLAAVVTAFVSLAPPILIQAVAGLALISAFAGSAMAAFKEQDSREAAAVTFLVTASGVSFAGISGAFWGLAAGGLMLALARFTRSRGRQ
jgi:benzoate membrane transport protein